MSGTNANFSSLSDESLVTMYQNCLRAIIEKTKFAVSAREKLPMILEEMALRTEAAQRTYYVETPTVGLLKTLGYRVGNNGEREKYRRQLLDYAVSSDLPFVGTISYSLSWGAPLSPTRFYKLVRTLEAFVGNAKNRPGMTLACHHWLADRNYIAEKWSRTILNHDYIIKVQCN